ncbi:expressed unknown protein [Seminavis robusta]|uniref:Uncharacterized protein n=1 Tax=Seminavis robusta TaxID=568900 RepID=A0A9N8EDI8_9STRA|nr:expressed unknown protein [Seminavis robusta]|eukprot:Sro790_g202740.1 n/a (211) ;mRNA; r:5024-5656
MLKDNITLGAARMRSHKRAKSMLCDMSLLDVSEEATGCIKSGHKRSKSQSILSFDPSFPLLVPLTAPATMASTSALVTPPQSPAKRARTMRPDDGTTRGVGWPHFSPPPVIVSRPILVSLTTTSGGTECVPEHLLMPSLEDLEDDENGHNPFLLQTERREPSAFSRFLQSPHTVEGDDTENDVEVAALTTRVSSRAPRLALRPLQRHSVI